MITTQKVAYSLKETSPNKGFFFQKNNLGNEKNERRKEGFFVG